MNILKNYPAPEELIAWNKGLKNGTVYNVNSHVHTP